MALLIKSDRNQSKQVSNLNLEHHKFQVLLDGNGSKLS